MNVVLTFLLYVIRTGPLVKWDSALRVNVNTTWARARAWKDAPDAKMPGVVAGQLYSPPDVLLW